MSYTAAELMQRTTGFSVFRDAVPKTVTWDVDTTFVVLVTPYDNSLEFEPGGSIQKFAAQVFLPKFYPDADYNMIEQLPLDTPDGIPGEGDMISIDDVARRVTRVEESPEGSGWTLTVEGPD